VAKKIGIKGALKMRKRIGVKDALKMLVKLTLGVSTKKY
jgi:hypothetical protein